MMHVLQTLAALVMAATSPPCAIEDGSTGPLPCVWDDGTGDRVLNHSGGSWTTLHDLERHTP